MRIICEAGTLLVNWSSDEKEKNLKSQSAERTLLQCKCWNHGAGLFTCLASLHAQPFR